MILRKPYAFLIKYFRLIHLFICLLMIFLISKTNNVLTFFKDYMNNDIFKVNVSEYINILTYLSLVLIIGLVITMIVLMKKKNKPVLLYVMTVICYVLLFAGIIYSEGVISKLQYNFLGREQLVLVRDINRFMLIGEWLFLIPFVIRTLGFDIKKFDFKKDLQELEIEVTDNEEFELLSPIDIDDINKKGRKKLRELKYYYIENKFFILIILAIFIVFVSFKVITNIDIDFNSSFKEKEVIKLDDFYTFKVEDSYITNKDYNNKEINIGDKSFLIVKFTVNSKYNGKFTLDTNKFFVTYKDEKFIANRTYYKYFSNYGAGYKNQEFLLGDTKTYILVYLIPNKYKDKKLKLEYNYRYDYSNNKAKMIKKKVKLEPEYK